MINSAVMDAVVERITALFPRMDGTVATDIKKNLRALLSSSLANLDLVTREEFDVQTALLARTRERLEQLEDQVRTLESLLAERDRQPPRSTQ